MSIKQELANIAALASGQQLPPLATADESVQVVLILVKRLASLMLEMGYRIDALERESHDRETLKMDDTARAE